MTNFITAEPQLLARDVAATVEFFSSKLGFDVAFTYGEPPFYAQVRRGGARLNLRHVDEVPRPSQRDDDQVLAATIVVDDSPALFETYRNAGVEFAQPLRTEPWGARTFIVRDPSGNLLLFAGD